MNININFDVLDFYYIFSIINLYYSMNNLNIHFDDFLHYNSFNIHPVYQLVLISFFYFY
jgi:hypothetical protein